MKRRILLLSDTCNPEWPSLPVVGYKYAKALAEVADVEVVTQIRNKPNIQNLGCGKAKVTYIDTESVAAPLEKLAARLRGSQSNAWTLQMAMDYPAYLWFERTVWTAFKDRLSNGDFDLVHRITPMSPTTPSYLAKRCPIPFVLGPLNGNLRWPSQFKEQLRREKEWLTYFRGLSKYMPYRNATFEASSCILAAFQHTADDLDSRWREKVINFPEVGIDPDLFKNTRSAPAGKITILYAGRLVPYKLPEVVIRAVAQSSVLKNHHILIAGEGSERPRLESMIEREGLAGCVEMLGNLPQREIAALMQRSDIFAFPSIRELGAGVVIEAMASGLACVVIDYGGPGALINSERGRKIPVGTLDQLVESFAKELESLVNNPPEIERLGSNAAQYAQSEYSWQIKAERTASIYEWVLGGKRNGKPVFWPT